MRGIVKKLGTSVVALVMVCAVLTGCGEISKDDIVGDWTTSTINGQSVEEYGASLGLSGTQAATNITIRDDDTMVSTNLTGSTEFDIVRKADGFEVKQKGQSEVFMSVKYDKDAKTLAYSVQDGQGGTVDQIMVKGNTPLEAGEAAPADDGTGEATEEATEEAAEGAAEEGVEEGVEEGTEEEVE